MPYSRSTGVDIWYESHGDGPAMLLVHANPFDNNLWMYQVAHFSTWYRVISIDIRGYGRSTKVTTPYSLQDMAADVVGVMDQEGIGKAILGGCSVGSSIALDLALDRPERFSALILVGGNSASSDRYQTRIDGYAGDLPSYHRKHMRILTQPAFQDGKLGHYLLETFAERQPRLSGAAIGQVFRAGNGTDNTARLSGLAVPTLVINGEFDHSMAAGQKTASLIPGATHKTIVGANHACCLEDPAAFDAAVLDFLDARGLLPQI
ncbi:MAG TPA: alpha/beta hydrolase [Alphaproteobacteria bacterium]|jgi:pimeloyl-ACP methyl ester carboxylesterase